MNAAEINTDRFFAKVVDPTPGKCWEWGGSLNKDKYGLFRVGRDMRLAHRVSYVIHRGLIPDGKYVMHTCDNPSCVNPYHLTIGTQLENMQDAKAKNRNAHGDTHAHAVLTSGAVVRIRALYATGLIKQIELARAFGVTDATINHVVQGKTWTEAGGEFSTARRNKLSDDKVREIRTLHASGSATQDELAVMFGVKKSTINKVVNRVAWAHVV